MPGPPPLPGRPRHSGETASQGGARRRCSRWASRHEDAGLAGGPERGRCRARTARPLSASARGAGQTRPAGRRGGRSQRLRDVSGGASAYAGAVRLQGSRDEDSARLGWAREARQRSVGSARRRGRMGRVALPRRRAGPGDERAVRAGPSGLPRGRCEAGARPRGRDGGARQAGPEPAGRPPGRGDQSQRFFGRISLLAIFIRAVIDCG